MTEAGDRSALRSPSFTQRRKAHREAGADGARLHFPSQQTPFAPSALTAQLLEEARKLGFVRVGVMDLERPRARGDAGRRALERWLNAGYAGAMVSYLGSGPGGQEPGARAEFTGLMPGARSLVVVALKADALPKKAKTPKGSLPLLHEAGVAPLCADAYGSLVEAVATYARGEDYHHALKDRLLYLGDILADLVGRPVWARGMVDTAPLLEREAALEAGLGFMGKNTMLIAPGQGSSVLLGSLVTEVPLEGGYELVPNGCGHCTACLDACPTAAFVNEYVLDARRCISYLTIELQGSIPRELRDKIGVRVFGCDECQTVCPYNGTRRAEPSAPELRPRSALSSRTLVDLLFLGSAQYRVVARGSALRRTFREQLCRNAAVALGNTGDPSAVEPLARAARIHPFLLVREHAAWALGRLGQDFAIEAASRALEELVEHPDPEVRAEVQLWRDARRTPSPVQFQQ